MIRSLKNKFQKRSFRSQMIFANGASGLAVKGTNLLYTFITIYSVNEYFSDEKFAVYLIIVSLLGMLGFADFGLGYGLFNQLAKDKADAAKIKKSISSAFFVLLGIGFCISLGSALLYFINPPFNLFNAKETHLIKEGNDAGYLFFLIFGVTLPFTIIRKIQGAFQESYKGDFWDIGGNIASIALFFLLINQDRGLLFLILIMIGVKNIAVILNFLVYFFYKKREFKPRILNFENSRMKTMMREGGVFFILQIIAMVLNSGDTFMISHFYGTGDAAEYAIGYRVFTFYFVPIVSIMSPFLAANNNALAHNDFDWLKKSFNKSAKFLLLISIISGIVFLTTTNIFINIWLGADKEISFSYLLAFSAFILYSNFNALYSQLMMSYVFINKYLLIYAVTGVAVLSTKFLVGSYLPPFYFIWSTIVISILFYFLPAHILFLKTSFGKTFTHGKRN